jgi:predicted TIM-barrel fold metal-dependent hydrolase
MAVDGYRVYDNHLHIQPLEWANDELQAFLEPETEAASAFYQELAEDPEALLDFLEGQGIDRAGLIVYVVPERFGFPAKLDDWLADHVDGHDALVPIGGVHPHHVDDPAAELDRLVDDLGIQALKIHPPHQALDPTDYKEDTDEARALAALYERLEEREIPLVVHTGTSVFPKAYSRLGDPMLLDDVATDHPALPIVLAHSGRPLWCDEAFYLARRHDRVWLDLSSIPPRRVPDYLPRLPEVADKTLWGTDWPGPGVPRPRENVEAFLDLDLLDPDQKQAILWDNNVDVFGGP